MSYSKKRTDIFVKQLMAFVMVLFWPPVYADSLSDMINGISGNESEFCTETKIKTKTGSKAVVKTETNCFFPEKAPVDYDIYIKDRIIWDQGRKNLVFHTKGSIFFEENGKIVNKGNGSVILKAGMEPGDKDIYESTVKFKSVNQIEMPNSGNGKIKIYYNPQKGEEEHKYHNPTIYSNKLPKSKLETNMLVNDIYDLQDVTYCLYCHYALSQDIDASPTFDKNWGNGHGFAPIKNIIKTKKDKEIEVPFSGVFDGNNRTIANLYINRPLEEKVGLFGDITGGHTYNSRIRNFTIKNSTIIGKRCIGAIIGHATGATIVNVYVEGSKVEIESMDEKEKKDVGKIAGCVLRNHHEQISASNTAIYESGELKKDDISDDHLFGSCVDCETDQNIAEEKDEDADL